MAPWRTSLIVAALAAAVSGFPQTGSDPGLIVHEWGTFTSVVDGAGRPMEWRPFGRPSVLPEERDESRYYAARATDAVPLAVEGEDGTQEEKFLFYRGAGRIVPPVLVALRGEDVVVSDYGAPGVSEVVLFENRGGRTSYLVRTKGGGQASLSREATGGTMESLRTDLEALLVRHGLFAREAAAMLETWGDSWFEEGTRVFYVVPQGITDAALPLSIDPRPTRTVRVLVART